MAAHSCLTSMKSFGGARSTAATAALNASVTDEMSEASDVADLWLLPLDPLHSNRWSPEELLHSFLHFLFLPQQPPLFSWKGNKILLTNNQVINHEKRKKMKESYGVEMITWSSFSCFLSPINDLIHFPEPTISWILLFP